MFPRGRGPHSCVFVPSGPPFAHATNVLQRVPWPLPPPADSCYTTRAGVQDLKVRSAVSAARTSLWLATTTPRAHGHARPVSLIWLLPYPGLCPWLRERQGPTREAIRKRALGVDHQAATRPRCATPLYRPGTRQPRRCMRGTALTSTHHHYRHCCASRRGGPPPPLRPTPAPRHSLHPPAAIRGSKLRRAATHTSYLTTRRSGWAPPARRHEQPHLICICRMVAQSTLFFLTRYFSCCTQAAERCAPRNDCRRRWLDSWRAGGTSAGAVDPTAADCIPTRRAVSVYLVPPAIAPKGVPAVVRLWPLRTS